MTDTVLVTQPTSEPTRKTTAAITGGGVATAVSVVMGWLLRTYTNVEIPAEVQVAIACIVCAGASYITKERVTL